MTTFEKTVEGDIPIKSRLVDVPRRNVLRLNQRLGRFHDVVWLIGDGRSGTTWLSDMINHHKRYREIFEPFRPARIDAMQFLRPHEYVRPGDDYPELLDLVTEVLSGRFTHPRVDSANRRPLYRGMLVKDVYANLLAYWATEHVPRVRTVLLVRNPFAVALSKQRKAHWFWATDPAALLAQPKLREDHLRPHEDLIRRTSHEGDDLQRQLLTWAILNCVPLRQFDPEDLHVCFYEELYANPEAQLASALDFIDPEGHQPRLRLKQKTIERPSRTVGDTSNILAGTSPVTSWKSELTATQIDRGFALLSEFGLADLYDSDGMPDRSVLDAARSSSSR